VVFVARGFAFGLAGGALGFRAAKGFAGDQQQSLRPIFTERDVNEARLSGAHPSQFAGDRRGAENYGGGGGQRLQNFRELAFAERSDDDEFVGDFFVLAPQIAAEHGDSRRLAFGLPASRE